MRPVRPEKVEYCKCLQARECAGPESHWCVGPWPIAPRLGVALAGLGAHCSSTAQRPEPFPTCQQLLTLQNPAKCPFRGHVNSCWLYIIGLEGPRKEADCA